MERPKKLGYYKDLLPKHIYKIYCNTYWGSFQYDEYEKEELYKLIKNRETIIDLYNIKKRITNIPKKYYKNIIVIDNKEYENYKNSIMKNIDFANKFNFKPIKYTKRHDREYFNDYDNFMWGRDHTEYYITKNNQIVSIFSTHTNDYELECIEKSGYKLIEPIYWEDQKTFIKIIDKY